MQPFALAALWIALLLCSPVLSSASNSSDATDSLNLAQLSQQVQELSQLLSQVVGAEPVDSYGSSLLPSSSITQRLIARQPELWPHQFTFLSAVAADSSITCSHVLSNKAKHAGAPLYVVLGDQAGRLYFFTPQGTLLFEHDTGVRGALVRECFPGCSPRVICAATCCVWQKSTCCSLLACCATRAMLFVRHTQVYPAVSRPCLQTWCATTTHTCLWARLTAP